VDSDELMGSELLILALMGRSPIKDLSFAFSKQGQQLSLAKPSYGFGGLGSCHDLPGSYCRVAATACDFTYQDATGFRALRISVEQSKDPIQTLNLRKTEWGSGASAVPAIGNEAVICSAGRKRRIDGEDVIGRVRDNLFTVRLLAKNGDPLMPRQALEEKTERVAEQVAGNLF
jgi:hypothetical protein